MVFEFTYGIHLMVQKTIAILDYHLVSAQPQKEVKHCADDKVVSEQVESDHFTVYGFWY